MEYVTNNDDLEKLIDFYDIENRKELIGDDNSLKRARRAICEFLESKQPVGVLIKYTMKKGENLSQVLWQLIEDRYKSGDSIKIYIQKVKE